ncbi:MAG: EscU/YscU/HrcU family type III secretion system export apparatus switch protein [Planctomycetota bacterium]
MSVDGDDADRLFPPTPRRREEARRSGRVAHSRPLVSALITLAAMAALRWGGGWLWVGFRAAAERPWSGGVWIRSSDIRPLQQTRDLLMSAGLVVVPWLLLLISVAILANVAQFGFLFRPERLAERWESPLGMATGGAGRRFRDLIMSLTQTAIVAGVAFWRLAPLFRGDLELQHLFRTSAPSSATMSLAAGPSLIASWGEAVACVVTETGVYASGLLVVIGLVDYGWCWWRLERSLWMTTEEMREELRGDSARHQPRRAR